MKRFVVPLLATVALGACAMNNDMANGGPPAGAMAGDPSNPMMAAGNVPMAASSDQFEIQSGQMALQMSQNPAIRQFAQMLIQDHQQTTASLMAAAQSAGLPPPPPTLLPQHQALLDQLRGASGPNFDVAFRDAQVQAHQQALQLHQGYASGGDVPALRQVAATAVPVIQNHLNMAQQLQVGMAGGAGMAPMQGMAPDQGQPAPAPAPAPARGERG
jgi:putative membrane protein